MKERRENPKIVTTRMERVRNYAVSRHDTSVIYKKCEKRVLKYFSYDGDI